MVTCRDIQERLVASAERPPGDPAVREHLDGCPTCRAFAERLAVVDGGLGALGPVAPAADLVRRTLAGVAADRPRRRPLRLALAFGSVAGLVLAAGVASTVLFPMYRGAERAPGSDSATERVAPGPAQNAAAPAAGRYRLARGPEPAHDGFDPGDQTIDKTTARTAGADRGEGERSPAAHPGWADGDGEERNREVDEGRKDRTKGGDDWSRANGFRCFGPTCADRQATQEEGRAGQLGQGQESDAGGKDDKADEDGSLPWALADPRPDDGKYKGEETEDDERTKGRDRIAPTGKEARVGALRFHSLPADAEVTVDGVAVPGEDVDLPVAAGPHRVTLRRDGHAPQSGEIEITEGQTRTVALVTAGDFGLDPGDDALEGLTFLPARGYFANTYVPGDPRLTWLRRSLAETLLVDGRPLRLEGAAAPYAQPFDAPATDGLAVYLSADRAQLAGPTRLTVQVGLKGSERNARRRAALDGALVVDLRAVPDEAERRALWTLADELAARREAGDRFVLVVAGVPQPLRVAAAAFDGPAVRRALAEALEARLAQGEPGGTLADAFAAAWEQVAAAQGDGDAAPQGASVVLFASAAPVGPELDALQAVAHAHATNGVTLSALGVGARADAAGLEALALAGQGRRRLVLGPDDARAVLESELTATGRVVARAVRLRIRLADGVRLVAVLGSHPLGNRETERVRAAEQAVDERLARTLGIAADRGEDEDGVQIVIPAFYAGDEHVVLLDVVASGPGPVADVRVRYKDLVRLDNAVARARLELPATATAAADGPLVRNVKKNRQSFALSQDLEAAAAALAAGDGAAAGARVERAAARLAALQEREPALRDDADLRADAELLAGYGRVLADRAGWEADPAVRDYLVRSLTYAGLARLAPGSPR